MSWPRSNDFGNNTNLLQDSDDESTSAKHPKILSMEEQNHYCNLTRYSNEKCLYCCRLFFNKLQLYMHNTRHLYIPVEKQQLSESVIQSLKASQQIPHESQIPEESQTNHLEKMKKNPMEKITNKKTQIRNVGFKKMLSKTYRKLQDRKEKSQTMDIDIDRKILNHKDNLLKDLMTECKVNLGENIPIPFPRNIRVEEDTNFGKGPNIGKGTNFAKGPNFGKGTDFAKGTHLAKGQNFARGTDFTKGKNLAKSPNFGKGTNFAKGTNLEKGPRIEKVSNQPENSILSKFTTNCIVNLNDFFTEIKTEEKQILRDCKSTEIQESKVKTLDKLQKNPISTVLLNKNITIKGIDKKNEFNKSRIQTEYKIKSKTDNERKGNCKTKDLYPNNMVLIGKKADKVPVQVKSEDLTVAYDKLLKHVKKGVPCRVCSKDFTNRYNAIVHESQHMLLKIPKVDKKPYMCFCQTEFKTYKPYLKHIKTCLFLRNRDYYYVDGKIRLTTNANHKEDKHNPNIDLDNRNIDLGHQNTKMDPQNIDLGHKNEKTDHQNIDLVHKNTKLNTDHENTDLFHKNTKMDHQNIDLLHQNIDHTTIDSQTIQNPSVSSQKAIKTNSNTCYYCNSDSLDCSEKCSLIRSDVMRSGNSTYFCKDCFNKMEVNLTKVGMFNGQGLDRRCVVCNSVGCNFVLAFMTAECVLGI